MATLIDSYTPSDIDSGAGIQGSRGQTFEASSFTSTLDSARFVLSRDSGTTAGTLRALVYATTGTYGVNSRPTGSAIAVSDSVAASSLPVGFGGASWRTFTFSGANRVALVASQIYAVCIEFSGGSSSQHVYLYSGPGAAHDGNAVTYSSSWYAQSRDLPFMVYADLPPVIYPNSIAPSESVSNVTVSVGAVSIAPASIGSAEAVGAPSVRISVAGVGAIASGEELGSLALSQSPPPPPPATDWSALGKEDEKTYIYRVYNSSGTFVGVWADVLDVPEFTEAINTAGTVMTVQLARSANTRKEVRGYLLTEAGDRVTTESGDYVVTTYESNNTVGEGSDVDLNYNVDVYVVYGEYSRLITESGNYVTTESGDYIIVASGAPMGRRIFSGFVLDYESAYGETAGVTVTLASHGYELSKQLVLSGSSTTVGFTTTALETQLKSILDTNPGTMTYDSASIQNTGVSFTSKFVLNTKEEAIGSIYEQTPDGWYWRGGVADPLVHLKQVSATADHTFVLGRDIASIKVKRSIESLANDIYFVGGETTPGTPSTTLFKRYTDSSSLSTYPRRGLHRITDRRYTLAASTAARSGKVLGRYKNPIFATPVTISAARYDIEEIRVGQTVQFRGFGNFIDDLPPLQIVRRSYTPTSVTIEVGDMQERQVDALADVKDDLANERYTDLPTAPS